MKRISIFLLALFTVLTVFGAPIKKSEAVKLANRFITNCNLDMQQVSITDLVYTEYAENNDPVYYIFNKKGDGFIIVSAEDVTLPIIGYSDINEFDVNNIPINMREILLDYKSEVEYVKSSKMVLTDEIRQAREAQLNNAVVYRSSVSPLLGDIKWDQSPYYNALCPVYNSNYGLRCPVGCVATAMAQIMRYWEYPAHGQGSHSYKSNYGTLYADFDVDYDWASMPKPKLTSPNSECAKISYHCAVSVNMQFGPNGSGAYQTDVPYALINYFKYKNTAKNKHRQNYNATSWANIVRAELDAGRPVQYAGHGTGGGHSFVCDGYNNNGYFHFNWGWGGSSDGYFLLNALNPGSLGTGGGSGGFNKSQTIVIGIQPDGSIPPPPPPTPGELAVPTGLTTTDIGTTTATLKWNSVEDATGYVVQFRQKNNSWGTYDIDGTSANATDLTPEATYQWRVKAVNNDTESEYSSIVEFTTLAEDGGGTPVDYCTSTSKTSYYEWIGRIAMSNIDNYSGGNRYADYTDKVINVSKGNQYEIFMKSSYRGWPATEYWRIWIDYNQDGEFSSNELVVQGYYTAGYLLKSYITIPDNALLGKTRMRVSMKYKSYPTACETFRYGEVEDYTIDISDRGMIQTAMLDINEEAYDLKEGVHEDIVIYPNPADDFINVTLNEIDVTLPYIVFDLSDRVVMKGEISRTQKINISNLKRGSYILSIGDERPIIKNFIKK